MDRYPFTAVVGADETKLALLLLAIDPAIGGVLLRGEKGSAKTTLARGLAALLPGDAPFVDLPVGATEDRVIGSIDLTAALAGGEVRLRRGLLADADGGVLYVDEVNLLPDHLVDALLDVAASGVNRVEREGVAATHPARFVLIGSMNPEEGELRPQLLDRFGLAVDVRSPSRPELRAEAITRRLAFDRDPASAVQSWAESERDTAARLEVAVAAGPAALPAALVEAVAALCVAVGAEGLRADLVICRAAAALARWEGRDAADEHDVRRVAPMALAHRARRDPFDDHGIAEDRLEDALDAAFVAEGEEPPDRVATPDTPAPVVRLDAPGRGAVTPAPGRRSEGEGPRGRLVGDRLPGPAGPTAVAVGATVREVATRRARSGSAGTGSAAPLLHADDIREPVRRQRTANLIVLVVDASGSMGAERRMEAAKGAVLGVLADSYERRDRVALVTFRGDDASVALRPTGSVEVAKARLTALPTGGRTPLAAGILAGLGLATAGAPTGYEPLIVLLTDGRATSAPSGRDPVEAARAAAGLVRRKGVASVVVDVEAGATRLGLARDLADAMGARLLSLDELSAAELTSAVRSLVALP